MFAAFALVRWVDFRENRLKIFSGKKKGGKVTEKNNIIIKDRTLFEGEEKVSKH